MSGFPNNSTGQIASPIRGLQSIRNRFYYLLKPLIPPSARMGVRRHFAVRRRQATSDVWPIAPGSEREPEGWPGWPDGKKFALVLTHDVEGQAGLAKCHQIMRLEMELGFRSSFNFIPEGGYETPPELRRELVQNGFEVGVHDLKHNGRLFESRAGFRDHSARINRYLADWGAVGFRSAFMLHELDWLHDLDIHYDMSTFDTDPFEPQPEGRNTIFPFWVPCPGTLNAQRSTLNQGYAELPYTLPQDSTLFLVLREATPQIWLKKLDWIAGHGGMALINVHPDYIRFDGEPESGQTYPLAHYRRFLEHVARRHHSLFWQPLPKQMAAFASEPRNLSADRFATHTVRAANPLNAECRKIWIDLENTPHIPFFIPIIRELERNGHTVVLSARDAYQTCEMAAKYGLVHAKIGHHYGKHRLLKSWGLLVRSLQLLPFARREKPDLALNHGSRTQTLLCNLLHIPSVTIMDYEHSHFASLMNARWEIVPVAVGRMHVAADRLLKYSGIKEDVYVPDFIPDSSIYEELALDPDHLIVTVRPPATEAHYHNPESEILFEGTMEMILAIPRAQVVVLPRNQRQDAQIHAKWPLWFEGTRVIIPKTVVNGLNLLWHSDLVVSGGGTMNREAAALGVPVYSIFRGESGAVDRQLQEEGRLILIASLQELKDKIELKKRAREPHTHFAPRKALGEIVGHIERILQQGTKRVR